VRFLTSPTGAGLAIVIPAWMRWYLPNNPKQFERFAKEIFGLQNAEEGIDALERWFKTIGAPIRLSDAGIGADAVEAIAANAARTAKEWGFDSIYSESVIRTILEGAV